MPRSVLLILAPSFQCPPQTGPRIRTTLEAAKELEQVIAAEPFNAPARFKLSEAYRGLGRDVPAAEQRSAASEIVDRQKRISTLLKAREENPHSRAVYQELEQLHRALGDVEAARIWQRWMARVTPAD